MNTKTLVGLACALALASWGGVARAEESVLRAAVEASGPVTLEKQRPVEVRGKGRSWANLTPMRAVRSGAPATGFWLYLQDTKVEGASNLFTNNNMKTDAAGLYTAEAYIDAAEAPAVVAYLDFAIARYRELNGRDAAPASYRYNGIEDFTLELLAEGRRLEFSVYSSGKLLRGQSFAVANRQMKVTLGGVEEFEKLRAALQAGLAWFSGK